MAVKLGLGNRHTGGREPDHERSGANHDVAGSAEAHRSHDVAEGSIALLRWQAGNRTGSKPPAPAGRRRQAAFFCGPPVARREYQGPANAGVYPCELASSPWLCPQVSSSWPAFS